MPPIRIKKNDIYHQLNILRIAKSADPDNLHPMVLHETAPVIDNALSISTFSFYRFILDNVRLIVMSSSVIAIIPG